MHSLSYIKQIGALIMRCNAFKFKANQVNENRHATLSFWFQKIHGDSHFIVAVHLPSALSAGGGQTQQEDNSPRGIPHYSLVPLFLLPSIFFQISICFAKRSLIVVILN